MVQTFKPSRLGSGIQNRTLNYMYSKMYVVIWYVIYCNKIFVLIDHKKIQCDKIETIFKQKLWHISKESNIEVKNTENSKFYIIYQIKSL